MPSLSVADNTFESIVQELPTGIISRATELKAFRRSRVVKDPTDLLRAVMLYCGLDYSLREVAANFTGMGKRLSDEAVRGRLSRCEEWLQALLQEMLPMPLKDTSTGSMRLILIDGTTIQAPGATTTDYRVHIGWDCVEERMIHSLVTDKRTGESLKLFDWQAGDLAIADAAYATAQQLRAVTQKGAEYLVRCAAANIRFFSKKRERIDIVALLKKQEGKSVFSTQVWIEAETLQPAYLHAYRLPEEAVVKAHVRLRKRSIKSGSKTKAETIYLAGWMLLLTSVGPERMSAETVARLYRSRWQIEILIKRLKSVLRIDALRAKRGSHLARVYILGKFIYALLIEKRAMSAVADRAIEWRIWKIVAEQMRSMITLSNKGNAYLGPEVIKILKERPRKRKRLREQISDVLQHLQRNPSERSHLYP